MKRWSLKNSTDFYPEIASSSNVSIVPAWQPAYFWGGKHGKAAPRKPLQVSAPRWNAQGNVFQGCARRQAENGWSAKPGSGEPLRDFKPELDFPEPVSIFLRKARN